MSNRPFHSNADGFTLFESLVALAILAIGLAAFYRAIAGGAWGEQRIALAQTGLQIAQARLAAAGLERKLEVGTQSGEDAGGYRWTVTVRRYDNGLGPVPATGPAAYEVTAAVTWPGGGGFTHPSVQLTTIKLAPAS